MNPYVENLKIYQDELAISYMPAVKAMAARLKERLPSSVDFNDLVSIGLEELVKLAKRYDPKKNDNFWGYAQKRVYGSMLDFLRSLDTVSRGDRKLIKEIEKVVSAYYDKYNNEPDDKYIANKLGVSIEKIKRAKRSMEIYTVMPIEDQMSFFENVSKKVEEEELIEVIKKILQTMSKKEQLVIQLYYFEELSLKEIAQILEISESRVSQIHKKVIKKLRKELNG
ncbi:MAG TPA: RNA polymerase sigma factor FliA [Nautiliaceae bacterium]|nr:RNA polymerase sigma factor FliA [Nautiliaceae bacterium]